MAGACWLDISKFVEAGYEEDEVDQIGWYADRAELLQDKVQDVAQVDGAQDRGKAEKTLKWKKWIKIIELIEELTWTRATNLTWINASKIRVE